VAEPQRLTAEERSNLVAYLDNELQGELSLSIARKLASSKTTKHEVESLERTWELLDYLPRPKATSELATRTLTLAAQLDQRGLRFFSTSETLARRSVVMLAGAGLVGLVALLGYSATRWIWPDPTSRLARDLSIAEHLNEYVDVGSFEFLRLLDQSPHVFTVSDP
jgi:hypothetical protein